jgi:hypothetical protein
LILFSYALFHIGQALAHRLVPTWLHVFFCNYFSSYIAAG